MTLNILPLISTFFLVAVGDTSYGTVTVLASSYKEVPFLNSSLQDHIGDAYDTSDFCCHSNRISFYQHMKSSPCSLFVGSCRPCFSCSRFLYRRWRWHSFGTVFVQIFRSGRAFWSNSRESRDCHYRPDAADRFCYNRFRNLTLLIQRLLMRERLW